MSAVSLLRSTSGIALNLSSFHKRRAWPAASALSIDFRPAAKIEGSRRSLAAILSDNRSHQTNNPAPHRGVVDARKRGDEPQPV